MNGTSISTVAPANNEILKWNGSTWAPAAALSNYVAGTGIALSGNIVSALNSTAIWNANLLNGSSVSSATPSTNEVLKWNGSSWAPAAALSNYVAGTGIALSGNTVSALNSNAIWNANLLNGSSISTTTPANNEMLKWNGSEWIPGAAYDVGLGITLSGTTFSHTAHTGDATGVTSITVVALQGNSVSSVTPSTNEVLKWNGSAWTPAT